MGQRANQVAEELRKVVSMILLDDLNDPRLGFITVTHIDMTDDLRHARVYYSVMGTEAQQIGTEEALKENLSFIKKLAVERIDLKYAMEIHFERDRSIEQSFKIDEILKKIKKESKE